MFEIKKAQLEKNQIPFLKGSIKCPVDTSTSSFQILTLDSYKISTENMVLSGVTLLSNKQKRLKAVRKFTHTESYTQTPT